MDILEKVRIGTAVLEVASESRSKVAACISPVTALADLLVERFTFGYGGRTTREWVVYGIGRRALRLARHSNRE